MSSASLVALFLLAELPVDALEALRPPVSPKQQQHARFLMDGIQQQYERLERGVVRIVEQRESRSGQERHVVWQAFDRIAGWVRYDHVTPQRRVQYAVNDEDSLLHFPAPDHATHITRNAPDFRHGILDATPVDLRCFWFAINTPYVGRVSFDRYAAARQAIIDRGVVAYRWSEADDAYRLQWELRGRRRGRWVLELCRSWDSLPEFSQEEYQDPATGEWTVESRTEVFWEQKDGCWLPTEWVSEIPRLGEKVVVELEWESVNQPLPKELFQMAGFGAPPNTLIYDRKAGDFILEGRVGDPPLKKAPEAAPRGWDARRVTLIVVNGLILLAILAPAWMRRRRV